MVTGKIIKAISGFYYVDVIDFGIVTCKAKGIFRKDNIKPLVGDDVEIEVLDETDMEGNIVNILPRKNSLIRPAVANVDMALIIFAAANPRPTFNLLDRFLVMMEYYDIPVTICFNKDDLAGREYLDELCDIYEKTGYNVIFTSAKTMSGHDELIKALNGKISVVAGPSGAGKSSIINTLQSQVTMETGEISKKLNRGRHTTRHSFLMRIDCDAPSYIVDTPGFSTMDIPGFDTDDLARCFIEFKKYEPNCKFAGCSHINEPNCGIKDALAQGFISQVRYDDYVKMFEEISSGKRY